MLKKTPNQQACVFKATPLCIVRPQVHTHATISFPFILDPGVWLPIFDVSFDTVELCNFESDCF